MSSRTENLVTFVRRLAGASDDVLSPQATRVLRHLDEGAEIFEALGRSPVMFNKMIKSAGIEGVENMRDLRLLRESGDTAKYQRVLDDLADMEPDALARSVGIAPDVLRNVRPVHSVDLPDAPSAPRTSAPETPRGPRAGSAEDAALRGQLGEMQDKIDTLEGRSLSLSRSRNIHRALIASGTLPTALILGEYFSGGALSSSAVDLTFGIVEQLREWEWDALADFVEKNGVSAIAALADVMGTPRDAMVNATARSLEKMGRFDDAALLKISNEVFKADFVLATARIMANEDISEADKGQAIAQYVIDHSGVERERVEILLQKNPQVLVALNPEQRSALLTAFPSLQVPMEQHAQLYARGDETRGRARDAFDNATERGENFLHRSGQLTGVFGASATDVRVMRTSLTNIANGAFNDASETDLDQMFDATQVAVNGGDANNVPKQKMGHFEFLGYAFGSRKFEGGLKDQFNAYANLANYMQEHKFIASAVSFIVGSLPFFGKLPNVADIQRIALGNVKSHVPELLATLPSEDALASADDAPEPYPFPNAPNNPMPMAG